MYSFVNNSLYNKEKTFSRSSEKNASKLLEIIGEMILQYYIHVIIIIMVQDNNPLSNLWLHHKSLKIYIAVSKFKTHNSVLHREIFKKIFFT